MAFTVRSPRNDLEFGPIAEGNPIEVALLWGNPETGPAAVMVRFPEGYEKPWHTPGQRRTG